MSQTFHRFLDLAGEIRNQIWLEAQAQDVRILEVRWASDTRFEFLSCTPALLRACKEARSITKPLYEGDQIAVSVRPLNQILLASKRHIRKEAYFNFEKDILYFAYHFPCALTYGLLLESFIRDLDPIYTAKLRHLALCLPLQPLERTAEMLNNLRTIYDEDREVVTDSIPDSMAFFNKLQGLGRRPRNLSLESLTLVFDDPIIQGAQTIEQDKGVARMFKDVEFRNGSSRELWEERRRHCGWLISRPHEPRGQHPHYSLQERRQPTSTWGTSDIAILTSSVERVYAMEDK